MQVKLFRENIELRQVERFPTVDSKIGDNDQASAWLWALAQEVKGLLKSPVQIHLGMVWQDRCEVGFPGLATLAQHIHCLFRCLSRRMCCRGVWQQGQYKGTILSAQGL